MTLQWGRICSELRLTPLQIRNLYDVVWQEEPPAPEHTLVPARALLLWTADLLETTRVCTTDQRLLILRKLASPLTTYLESWVAADWTSSHPPTHPFHLLFLDRQFVTWTKAACFYRLADGTSVPQLEESPLESVGYDLGILFRRRWSACMTPNSKPPG